MSKLHDSVNTLVFSGCLAVLFAAGCAGKNTADTKAMHEWVDQKNQFLALEDGNKIIFERTAGGIWKQLEKKKLIILNDRSVRDSDFFVTVGSIDDPPNELTLAIEDKSGLGVDSVILRRRIIVK